MVIMTWCTFKDSELKIKQTKPMSIFQAKETKRNLSLNSLYNVLYLSSSNFFLSKNWIDLEKSIDPTIEEYLA